MNPVRNEGEGNRLAAEVSREFLQKFGKELAAEQRFQNNEFMCRFALADGAVMTRDQIQWLEVRLTLSGFEGKP